MNIHEYQAKQLLAQYGVAVPAGAPCKTVAEAKEAAEKIFAAGHKLAVVKSQIHAGGRGKGGGVKVAKTPAEAVELASKILGMTLVTHQTGPQGKLVQRLLVEEGLKIARELYLGIVLDRSTQKPVVMVSQDGGMEIEKVAAEKIGRAHV